jgi:hypothetical protein
MEIQRKKDNRIFITERTPGYKSKAKVIKWVKDMFEYKRENPKRFLT